MIRAKIKAMLYKLFNNFFLSLTAKIQESMIGNGKFSRKRGRMFSVGLKERGRIFSAALKEEGRRGERANEDNEEVRGRGYF